MRGSSTTELNPKIVVKSSQITSPGSHPSFRESNCALDIKLASSGVSSDKQPIPKYASPNVYTIKGLEEQENHDRYRRKGGWQFTGRRVGERRQRRTQGCRLDICVVLYLFERRYIYAPARQWQDNVCMFPIRTLYKRLDYSTVRTIGAKRETGQLTVHAFRENMTS